MSTLKKNCSDRLILGFFGDSGLAENLAFVPAYPSGMSYFRPFRYRDKWLDDKMKQLLKNPKGRSQLIGQNAVLATTFCSTDYTSLVLPIRDVRITHIDFIPDNISVYFQLGTFYEHDFEMGLREQCLEFASAEETPEDHLLFKCNPMSMPALWDKNEDEAWINWVNAISKDESLPFSDKARRSIFVRISALRQKKSVSIEKIHKSWSQGPIYGFSVREAQEYELLYLHRVPFLFGTSETVPKFKIKPISSTSNWEFSSVEEEISANYQLHAVTMTALSPSASWEQLLLQPDTKELKTKSSDKLNTFPIRFSLRIKKSWWYRFWTTIIWIVLLGVFIILKDVFSSILKDEDFMPDLFIGFLTFVVLLSGYIITQKKLLK